MNVRDRKATRLYAREVFHKAAARRWFRRATRRLPSLFACE